MTSFDAISPPPDTTLFSVVISLAAVSEIKSEIDSVIETDPPEDKPLRVVGEAAVEMIEAADSHSPIFLTASEIESFEGNLLVHWEVRNKRLTLIASGPDGRTKLYKKAASNLSEIIPNPSPIDLSDALTWIMQ
jgi:hypothetical protein